MNHSKSGLALALAFAAMIPGRAGAVTIYGVTLFRDLITFESAAPGTITTTVAITGLVGQDSFESVIGIDFSPSGQMYALGNAPGSNYRLYTLNVGTGVATQVGADFTVSGNSFGFDYDPEGDRLRAVSDANVNRTISPAGAVTSLPALAFAGADPNVGVDPSIVGLAQDNNVVGASSSTSYLIDSDLNVLTQGGSLTNGLMTTQGLLGFDIGTFVGFDIAGDGVAYLSDANPGTFLTNFYSVNLLTGNAALLGQVGDGTTPLNDITAAPIPEPSGLSALACAVLGWATRRRRV